MELLGSVEFPVGIKIATGAQRPDSDDCLGAFEPPAGSRAIQTILDQMTAGAFDHSRCNRQPIGEKGVVIQHEVVFVQIVGAFVHGLSLVLGKLLAGGTESTCCGFLFLLIFQWDSSAKRRGSALSKPRQFGGPLREDRVGPMNLCHSETSAEERRFPFQAGLWY